MLCQRVDHPSAVCPQCADEFEHKNKLVLSTQTRSAICVWMIQSRKEIDTIKTYFREGLGALKGKMHDFHYCWKKVMNIGIYGSSGVISPGKGHQHHPNPLCLVFSSHFYYLVCTAGCRMWVHHCVWTSPSFPPSELLLPYYHYNIYNVQLLVKSYC